MSAIWHTAVSIFCMERLPPCSLILSQWHFGSSEKKFVQTNDVVRERQYVQTNEQTKRQVFFIGEYLLLMCLNRKLFDVI